MKRITILFFAILISSFASAQENETPYRIGLKIGAPNIVGLDFEYVTPLWNNRVAPSINFSTIGFAIDNENKLNYSTFEVGTNIYFNDKGNGKGLYGGLSYQNISAKLKQENYEANDGRIFEGTTTSKIKYNGFNMKIGAKLGRKFYFRTELGYSFGAIPTKIITEGTYNEAPATDNQDISDDIDGIGISAGIPIFNIGFGFGF